MGARLKTDFFARISLPDFLVVSVAVVGEKNRKNGGHQEENDHAQVR